MGREAAGDEHSACRPAKRWRRTCLSKSGESGGGELSGTYEPVRENARVGGVVLGARRQDIDKRGKVQAGQEILATNRRKSKIANGGACFSAHDKGGERLATHHR